MARPVDPRTFLRETFESNTDVAVGALMTILGFLVLPGIVVAGYAFRVIGSRVDVAPGGGRERPGFHSPTRLLLEGTFAYGLWFAYYLVPLVLTELWITIRWLLSGRMPLILADGVNFMQGMGIVGGLPITTFIEVVFSPLFVELLSAVVAAFGTDLLVALAANLWVVRYGAIVTTLLATFLYPAALANAARHEGLRTRLVAGVRLSTVLRGAATAAYVRRWVVAMLLSLVGWAAVYLGIFVGRSFPGANFVQVGTGGVFYPTIEGATFFLYAIVAGLVYFVLTIAACGVVGDAWREVVSRGDVPERATERPSRI